MLIALTTSFWISLQAAPMIQENIEVRIGSRIITTLDVQEMADHYMLIDPKADRKTLMQQARERLIERLLIEDYLARYEMQATDRDLAMAASAASMTSFQREQLRADMNRSRFNGLALRNAARSPTQGELKEYFQKNKGRFSKNFEVSLAECRMPYGSDREATLDRKSTRLNSSHRL